METDSACVEIIITFESNTNTAQYRKQWDCESWYLISSFLRSLSKTFEKPLI